MKKLLIGFLILIIVAAVSAAGSASEESGTYTEYLASRGTIAPPEEIKLSAFVGKVNYHYPATSNAFDVTTYTGHRQVSMAGQEEYVVVGLQGNDLPFEDLPPLNLSFVIDRSGSMASENKLGWVKESLYVFLEKVRDKDFVSLVMFDDQGYVVLQSTKMKGNRNKLRAAIDGLRTGGGTNLTAGVTLGYEQVMTNYRKDYTNRVIFLTDGNGHSGGLMTMAANYRDIGINISTIGLGAGYDLQLLRDLARTGGGTSRFIANRDTMRECFGSGLGRMVVPVARDVNVEVELAEGVVMEETCAPDHRHEAGKEVYRFPAVHLGDYETIVMKLRLPEYLESGAVSIGKVRTSFSGIDGDPEVLAEKDIVVSVVDTDTPLDGISNAVVLRAGSMLRFATEIRDIGRDYYAKTTTKKELLGRTNAMKKELYNTRIRLDEECFQEEIQILERYIHILGGDEGMEAAAIEEVWQDREIPPVMVDVPLVPRIETLFNEMILDLSRHNTPTIAVSGFAVNDGRNAGLCDLLDEMAESSFVGRFTMVERREISRVLDEQELSLSGLVETSLAIDVGKMLSAEYILTGTVIPMDTSVVIFSRVIHVESSVVESSAQVIVPIDSELQALL